MATVGVFLHRSRPEAAALATEMAGWLDANHHEVRVAASEVAQVPALSRWGCPDDAVADGLDLAVSVGGDGTMLRTVHEVVDAGVPVLGVNLGHLGYLTEIEPGGWLQALERFLTGDYRVEERMTLDVEVHCSDGPGSVASVHNAAVNDAVVEKAEAGRTVRLGLAIGSRPFISYAADGLIVSTPTGSTAYNLSAGGPILSPALAALVVTPVAPHSLFDRTMVLAPGETVCVTIEDGSAMLAIDGLNAGRLGVGDYLVCRVGPRAARLVCFEDRDFRYILRAKFGLAVDVGVVGGPRD